MTFTALVNSQLKLMTNFSKCLLTGILLFGIESLYAQILEVPLGENPTLKAHAQKNPIHKNNHLDTIDIPFIDDFSYVGPYPSHDFWADNDAYVNTGLGIEPPTLGVATLDGLNEVGSAYGNGVGFADALTSNAIRLGSFSSASNIYLSFFYQPKGRGDKPEMQDSLVLEFKDNQGNWILKRTFTGIPASAPFDTTINFQHFTIKIAEAEFLFDGFQFRFRNYGSLTGSVDHWHIDYVRMTQNTIPSIQLNDIAFTAKPQSILKNYTAMPWNHFKNHKSTELEDTFELKLFNHFNNTNTVLPAAAAVMQMGTPLVTKNIFNTSGTNINIGNVTAGIHITASDNFPMATLENQLDAFDNETQLIVTSQFSMTPVNQTGTQAAIFRNDTTRFHTIFDNYFAYDDGEPELSIVAGRLSDQVAVKFHANVADTLRAVQLFIPHINGDVTDQRFNLKIWLGDLNTTPAYTNDFLQPIYVDSINGWTTYSLDTAALAIPVGDFYIGWQQAVDPSSPNESIPVGYDKNNPDAAQFNYQNIGSGWQPLNSTTSGISDGAILLRPIMGSETPFTTDTKAPKPLEAQLSIHPNPTRDRLRVWVEDGNYEPYRYWLFNAMGQLVQEGNLTTNIIVNQLDSGFYVLKIQHQATNQIFNHNFVKVD